MQHTLSTRTAQTKSYREKAQSNILHASLQLKQGNSILAVDFRISHFICLIHIRVRLDVNIGELGIQLDLIPIQP